MSRTHLGVGTLALALTLGLALAPALAGCASGSGSAAEEGAPRGVAPPDGHPLAKIERGMTPSQVSRHLGEPTREQTYPTGKSWIPFYFGSDTMRTDWKYPGSGRVVFGHNRWSGSMRVIRIDYDPEEDGR